MSPHFPPETHRRDFRKRVPPLLGIRCPFERRRDGSFVRAGKPEGLCEPRPTRDGRRRDAPGPDAGSETGPGQTLSRPRGPCDHRRGTNSSLSSVKWNRLLPAFEGRGGDERKPGVSSPVVDTQRGDRVALREGSPPPPGPRRCKHLATAGGGGAWAGPSARRGALAPEARRSFRSPSPVTAQGPFPLTRVLPRPAPALVLQTRPAPSLRVGIRCLGTHPRREPRCVRPHAERAPRVRPEDAAQLLRGGPSWSESALRTAAPDRLSCTVPSQERHHVPRKGPGRPGTYERKRIK